MTFDWSLVQSFLSVAEHGSYSAAARATGTSQPTIGRHIEQLQSQLGSVLFQRAVAGYELTETGAALMEHAQSMRQSAAQMSLITAGQGEDVRGTVRITASELVATFLLPQVIGPLLATERGLEVEVVATNSTENLLLREADIALRMTQPEQLGLIQRKLGEIDIGFFAAPSYLENAPQFSGLEDLKNHVLLGYDRSDLILRGMHQMGLRISRNDFAYRVDDQVAYIEALRQGVGLGVCQCNLAKHYGLTQLIPDLKIPSLPVWLTAHEELRTSAKVRRVFDHIAEHLPAIL